MGRRLVDKVAVVSGGGRGIGRGVALLLAEEGASVVVNDVGCDVGGTGFSRTPADQVVEEIRSKNGDAVASYDNVAVMEGGESLIARAVSSYGHLDILVNSVGVLRDGMVHEMTPCEFDQVIRHNVKGTFVPTRYAAIHFRRQRSGRIVNITSDAGLGDVGRSNYAAASEAIIGLTRAVARDMGKYGVACNAISCLAATRHLPGAMDALYVFQAPGSTTSRGVGIGPPSLVEEWEGAGGPDDPENVAPLVVFLCTDVVPDVNGYVFGVRGGGVFLYSNPSIERSLHKWGAFTMDEMDALAPKIVGAVGSAVPGQGGGAQQESEAKQEG